MALTAGNRILQTTSTVGAGTLQLGAAPDGSQPYLSDPSVNSGDTVPYCIVDDTEAPRYWEVGTGVITAGSPAQLTRGTVIQSSSGPGVKLNLPAGVKYVFCAVPASMTAMLDAGGRIPGLGGPLGALQAVVPATDRMPYFTGAAGAALAPISAFGRTLMDDVDAMAARATLGAMAKTGDTMSGTLTIASGDLQMGGPNPVIDANRVHRLRRFTQATLPAPSAAPQGLVECSDLAGSAGVLYSDGTAWQREQELGSYASIQADANATLGVLSSAAVVFFSATLTANRTVTLSPTGAYLGAMKRIIHGGVDAFVLVCGGVNIRTRGFADFMWAGSAWQCIATGTMDATGAACESGAWTPTVVGQTTAGALNYSEQRGYYIRIGNLVVATCYVTWSAVTTALAGLVRIQGLPFNFANGLNKLPVAALQAVGVNIPDNYGQLNIRANGAAGPDMIIVATGDLRQALPIQGTAIVDGAGSLNFTIAYEAM